MQEGFKGLYRGMAAPLTGVTPMYALCFFGYGVGKKIFCDDDAFEKLKLTQIALAGATSALFTTPILGPGERLKCVLQVRAGVDVVVLGIVRLIPLVCLSLLQVQSMHPHLPQFKGPMEVAKYLYSTGGLASVNRGISATLVRDGFASHGLN